MNDVIIATLAAIAIAVLSSRLASIERRLNRLSRLDAKLDAMLRPTGITFDEFADVPADVREALERGERILAIKRLRRAKGIDLKQAREFVDEVRRRIRIA
jgi:ribosomal protein L7/L12